MSIYDRQYMRFSPEPAKSNPLYWLLGLIIAGFFAQVFCTLVLKSSAVTDFLSMTGGGLLEIKLWTLLSYVLAHDVRNPLHILFNLLIIWMVGRVVLDDIGSRRFIWLTVFSAIGGALFFLVFHLGSWDFGLMGASAVAMGFMTVYCLARPDQPVTFLIFFVLPITVKPRYLLVGLAFVEVIMLTAELQNLSGVASSAHLGGMAAAFLYCRKAVQGKSFFPYPARKSTPVARRVVQSPKYMVNITSRTALRSEVDRILDKINSQGFGSLTDEEKHLLDQARDVLGK